MLLLFWLLHVFVAVMTLSNNLINEGHKFNVFEYWEAF